MKGRNVVVAMALLSLGAAGSVSGGNLPPKEELGKMIFFDAGLSTPPGQSCADCHDPATGWTGPDEAINAFGAVYPGAVFTRFGNRKPPTVAYGGASPLLQQCTPQLCGMGGMGGGGMGGGGMGGGGMGGGGMGGGMGDMGMAMFVGGMFWDGRAAGWHSGDPLMEQAMGPFLNPLEQANPNAKHVCLGVLRSNYATLFEDVWGKGSLDCVKDVNGTYGRIAASIASYERSAEVNPYSSLFDQFWRASKAVGLDVATIRPMNSSRFPQGILSPTELQGLVVFNSKGRCFMCHRVTAGPGNTPPLFTDFRYHNLGIPKNPENPFYGMPQKWNPDGAAWIDQGLGGFLATTSGAVDLNGAGRDYTAQAAANTGRHKTPTLRNVDKRPAGSFVKAYGHNGYFKSLEEIVKFYDSRDTLPVCDGSGVPGDTCWPAPEVPQNVNSMAMGNLALTDAEEQALIAFLKTLSDR